MLTLLLLISGCATLKAPAKPPEQSLSPDQLLEQAAALREKEQWVHAMQLLTKGREQHPDNQRIGEMLASLTRDWEMQKRNREDWILVYETEALQQKIPYLESLVEIDPNNIIASSRLLFWQNSLESKMAGLISCGSLHLHLDESLAARCAALADQIRPTRQSTHLISKIQQTDAERKKEARAKQTARKKSRQARQIARAKHDKQQQRERLLDQAKKQLAAQDYLESIKSLNQLLRLEPKDSTAKSLLATASLKRDERVNDLVKFGDQLYKDEYIEHAVTVWESAERLDPGRTEIAARIDRARTVMEKLREIQQLD